MLQRHWPLFKSCFPGCFNAGHLGRVRCWRALDPLRLELSGWLERVRTLRWFRGGGDYAATTTSGYGQSSGEAEEDRLKPLVLAMPLAFPRSPYVVVVVVLVVAGVPIPLSGSPPFAFLGRYSNFRL